jgi:hypothetical protein
MSFKHLLTTWSIVLKLTWLELAEITQLISMALNNYFYSLNKP